MTLQDKCEAWLLAAGYTKKSPRAHAKNSTGRFYLQGVQGKRICVADLILFDVATQGFCEVVIIGDNKLIKAQRDAVENGDMVGVASLAEFTDAIDTWEAFSLDTWTGNIEDYEI